MFRGGRKKDPIWEHFTLIEEGSKKSAQCKKCLNNLADACDVMLRLLEVPELQPHQDHLKHRFQQAIYPCHLVAHLMHPKYSGHLLTQEQVEEAKSWLIAKNPEFLPTAIAFQVQAAPFPPSFFQPAALDMDILTWWSAVDASSKLPQGFLQLMLQLHSATASSASLERVFSSFGLIQSKLRNRLGLTKACILLQNATWTKGIGLLTWWNQMDLSIVVDYKS